jgi:hypothetical protein
MSDYDDFIKRELIKKKEPPSAEEVKGVEKKKKGE